MHRYYLVVLLFYSQFVLSQSVQAQMYQWVDPDTGTTQLSGKPPAWYRSAEGGPRVFVFNRGKVVDDTGIAVSDEQRISLRRNAFVSAEEDRLAAKEKIMEAAKLKAAMQRNVKEIPEPDTGDSGYSGESRDEFDDATAGETVEPALTETDTSEEAVSIEKMKALISEWESKRTEEARALLKQGKDGDQ